MTVQFIIIKRADQTTTAAQVERVFKRIMRKTFGLKSYDHEMFFANSSSIASDTAHEIGGRHVNTQDFGSQVNVYFDITMAR